MRHFRTLPRTGVTLIEILIVIAIISLLVALTIPAVQAAREASRRASCANNLRQYGMAMHAFQTSAGSFPSGMTMQATGPIAKLDMALRNYMADLLPYLEFPGASLYDRNINFCDQRNWPVIAQPIPISICPSTPTRDANFESSWVPSTTMTHSVRETPILKGLFDYLDQKYSATYRSAFSDYTVLAGCEVGIAERLGFTPKPKSPVALSGMFPFPFDNEDDAFKTFGPILLAPKTIVISKGLRSADITDGLSNTLMVVEIAGRPQHWMGGKRTTLREPVDRPWADPHIQELNAPPSSTCLLQCDNVESLYGFHAAGANVAFADGHVDLLASTTESKLILEWMTPDGSDQPTDAKTQASP